MNGTRDPAFAGQRTGGGGEGGPFVSLPVRAGAHEGVLLLGAVGGGGQRVLGEGGHDVTPPVRERRRGAGRGGRALVAGFLLQELLLGRAGGREIQEAGGLQDGDAALPAGQVLSGGRWGGRGGASDRLITWNLVALLAADGLFVVAAAGVPELWERPADGIPLAVNWRGQAAVGEDGAAGGARGGGRARGARRRHAAGHDGALSSGGVVPIGQGVCGRLLVAGKMLLLRGEDVSRALQGQLSLGVRVATPLQQEALWGTI